MHREISAGPAMFPAGAVVPVFSFLFIFPLLLNDGQDLFAA
jgi:hypothetical protein